MKDTIRFHLDLAEKLCRMPNHDLPPRNQLELVRREVSNVRICVEAIGPSNSSKLFLLSASIYAIVTAFSFLAGVL